LTPELIVTLGVLFILLADLFLKEKRILAYFSLIALVIAGLKTASLFGHSDFLFSHMLAVDSFSFFFKLIALFTCGLTILSSLTYRPLSQRYQGEYYVLLLSATLGIMLLASSSNLISLYLALELTSIPCYILTGFLKWEAKSSEAAIKYFLLGALASGTMLYGMSIIYGITGTTDLEQISQNLSTTGDQIPLILLSILFLLCGFGFKMAIVPFHMWCPDTYEGAPTPITAFLSVGPKAAGFSILIRFFLVSVGSFHFDWTPIVAILSILSMTLGNLIALSQTNIKRMLAYSSIAQAGYILIGFVVSSELGLTGVLLYLIAYLFMNLGAFVVVIIVSNTLKSDLISDYAGLAKKAPLASLGLALFLLALAGIPPTAGFIGKFYVFASAIQSGWILLALAGVLNSVISVFYYANVIRQMYILEPKETGEFPRDSYLRGVLLLTIIFTLFIGVYPEPFIRLSQVATQIIGRM